MALLFCSFAGLSRKNYDISKRYPGVKELFCLDFGKKDIRSHLRTITVGQTSLPTVRDLILACTGHLCEDRANKTICPAHRAELGMFWRPWRKCAHSVRGNGKSKPWRGGNLTMSKEIMAKWDTDIILVIHRLERTSATEESPQLKVI